MAPWSSSTKAKKAVAAAAAAAPTTPPGLAGVDAAVPTKGAAPITPYAEALKAARGSLVRDKLSQDTALAVGNTGAEFDAFIKAEQARWKPVIARAQIKPEGV